MSLSYDDIDPWLKKHNGNLNNLINKISNLLKQDEISDTDKLPNGTIYPTKSEIDDYKFPIYTTKYRIKSCDSIYLKGIIDDEINIDKIDDIVGFRIVCLFEKDIERLHRHLIKALNDEGFKLNDFKIFNWKDDNLITSLRQIVKDIFGDISYSDPIKKKTGYKSLHYLVSHITDGKEYRAEIQLRTLLQDVWGELEHKLSYKQGNIHPHIRKSFELLANELENNDALISHLKQISDQEYEGHIYSIQRPEPVNYYGYEKELIPDIFYKEDPFKQLFEDYYGFLKGISLPGKRETDLVKANQLYCNLTDGITQQHERQDQRIEYFKKMEEAFLLFWAGGADNLKKALKIYNEMKDSDQYKDRYIIYARMGEIYFIQGNNVKALSSFDKCEKLVDKTSDYINRIGIKHKLASIYWLLGYVSESIIIIKKAYELFNETPEEFSERTHKLILNNLCAYQLEVFLKTRDETDYTEFKGYLAMLEDLIRGKDFSSNVADTVAWAHYHVYRKEGDLEELKNARKYAIMISDKENVSTMKFLSYSIQKNHIQEIMNAWHDTKMLA